MANPVQKDEQRNVMRSNSGDARTRWSRRLSLTSRILFVNVVPLVLLGGGIIYLDSYRKQLLDERFKLCLLYTSPSPRDKRQSRMPSSA